MHDNYMLRRELEKTRSDLSVALEEASVLLLRRDWAFSERDKIVAERESVRALCDNLRREKDKAVGNLAQALRDLDDTRRELLRRNNEVKDLMVRLAPCRAGFHGPNLPDFCLCVWVWLR